MAWDTGTITDATPHNDLSQKIKDLCGDTGVVNWSFVENIPAGTSAGESGTASYSVDVFLCKGSGTDANDATTDWYMGFGIPVTDGAVGSFLLVAEGYLSIVDNPAHADRGKFKRPCSMGTSSVSTVPTGAGFWITDAYGTWTSYSTTSIKGSTAVLNTSGFTYYIKMTKNLLIVVTVVGATASNWFGMLLDSLTVTSDPCPLVGGTTLSRIGTTRLPGVVTASVTDMWEVGLAFWTNNVIQKGGSNVANTNDFWQSNKIHVARMEAMSGAAAASSYLVGAHRGLLKADLLAFQTGGTVAAGDTVVIDGNTWTVIDPAGFGAFTSILITRAN